MRHVGKKLLKWKLSFDENDDSWDLFWADTSVLADKLARMKPYQRVNHFPGMHAIARKNHLGINLKRMSKLFPEEYNFFPKTWLLPSEYPDFKEQFKKGKSRTYILKPESSSQGRGIFLIRRIEQINMSEHYVAQRYIAKPFLIDGLKFDLRIYVLITGCDPLRIFIYEEGLTRFATETYKPPTSNNLDDICMHLTNYAVNKHNEKFIANHDADSDNIGHKRSLSSTLEYLADKGYDVDELWSGMCDIVIKTLCSIQPHLAHIYRSCQPDDYSNGMCFEILGFDIIIDHKLKPWLLEVNHSPSFSTESPLDRKIKKAVIKEAIDLMNITPQDQKNYEAHKRAMVQKRMYSSSFSSIKEEKEQFRIACEAKRDKFEEKNCGGYIKIYPCEDKDYYSQFITGAREIWEKFTGSRTASIPKTRINEVPTVRLKETPEAPKRRVLTPSDSCNILDIPRVSRNPSEVFDRLFNASKPKRSTDRTPRPPRTPYEMYLPPKISSDQALKSISSDKRIRATSARVRSSDSVNNSFKEDKTVISIPKVVVFSTYRGSSPQNSTTHRVWY